MEYYTKLKQTREDLDITQAKVAEAIGTTQQQIFKYENGIQDMTVAKFKMLCEYYNVSADYILGLPKKGRWPR